MSDINGKKEIYHIIRVFLFFIISAIYIYNFVILETFNFLNIFSLFIVNLLHVTQFVLSYVFTIKNNKDNEKKYYVNC